VTYANVTACGNVMSSQRFIEIRAHSRRKYSIVRKYLGACKKFSDKYQNFVYIDTHGGTGKVLDLEINMKLDGSVLTAAKLQPSFPCYVVEIDPDNFRLLRRTTNKFSNITLFHGDCNEKIDEILGIIPKGEKFVFCFLDPDGLVYHGKNSFAISSEMKLWRRSQNSLEPKSL